MCPCRLSSSPVVIRPGCSDIGVRRGLAHGERYELGDLRIDHFDVPRLVRMEIYLLFEPAGETEGLTIWRSRGIDLLGFRQERGPPRERAVRQHDPPEPHNERE